MNILFFLTPKNEVDYVEDNATLMDTLEVMERNNYSAIPIISRSGRYVGTIGEGDILRYIRNSHDFELNRIEDTPIKNIEKSKDNSTVNINSKFDRLVKKAMRQNFVPVVDDDNKFIGIITRREIMEQWHKLYLEQNKSN